MTLDTDNRSTHSDENRLFEEASEWFLRLRAADPASDAHAQLQAWCAQHPLHESAYRKVAAAWVAVGANTAAPEFLVARRDALERARRAARDRWNDRAEPRRWMGWAASFAAAAASLVLLVWGVDVWQTYDRVQIYETAVGETRALTLPDNSRVTLDAESRVTVAYSADIRLVELSEGQAQFDVAKDPRRVFKVKVGNETVVARGTAFNIEHRDDQVSITLIQGHIIVTQGEQAAAAAQPDPATVRAVVASHELAPGEQLIIKKNGQVEPRRKVSLEKVTAWRRGKIILQDEPLSEACVRMNRYSRIKIDVQDKAVAHLGVSGVFEAGDTGAFAEAVESLFGLKAVRIGNDSILLVRAE